VVTFLRLFENPKNMTFYVFLRCCTRFLEHWIYRTWCYSECSVVKI